MRVSGKSKTQLRPQLLAWYDLAKRDLPWRRNRDPYAIWLSEVMLQQTQVQTVIPYYARFLTAFPTVAALAGAPLADVLAQWRGLGYYSRARNLHRAAQELVSRFGGKLPEELDSLRSLPGFGRYTSGAVASIAFGVEAPLVDGNVARVFSRLFEVEGLPGDKARESRLWELASMLVQGERPGDLNQALMELGATVCRPEDPLCLLCPVRDHCQALAAGRVDELPPPKVRAPRKALKLSLGVVSQEGRLLLGRRAEKGLFGGLWELPSIEEPVALSPKKRALAFSAAFGVPVRVAPEPVAAVKRTLTHRDLTLTLYPLEVEARPRLERYLEHAWVAAAEATALGMSTAMERALEEAFRWLRPNLPLHVQQTTK